MGNKRYVIGNEWSPRAITAYLVFIELLVSYWPALSRGGFSNSAYFHVAKTCKVV